MATKFFDDTPKVAPTLSAEIGKPGVPPVTPTEPEADPTDDIDAQYWIRCLDDGERAEQDWRSRGREIIRIYRNDGTYTALNKKRNVNDIVFNILFSNTEVMLPNIYANPPAPIVRSRFVKKSVPVPVPPPPPPMPPPMGATGPLQVPPGPGMPGGPPMAAPPAPPSAPLPPTPESPNALGIDINVQGLHPPQPPVAAPPPEPPPAPEPEEPPPPSMPPMVPAPPPPGMPDQKDVETAAAVMEKCLSIVLDDTTSHEAIKAAVKDMLLPGRGTCRVRWFPHITSQPAAGTPAAEETAPPATASLGGAGQGLAGIGDNGGPAMEDVKIWETVNDEYVYWEDILYDPVRQFADGSWIAFRHLFDEKSLLAEFPDSQQLQALKSANKMQDVLKWTEESAAKSVVGGGSPMKTANKLGDVIKKAMVWEIWNKTRTEVIWMIKEVDGIVLRVDPDSLGLSNFFPVPKPLLAVTTTDSMLPRPYYDLYRHLAADLDETSRRISHLTEKIKVRGGYNASNKDIAALLTAEDGKMLPVAGVDLINGGLANHIWLVPIVEWVNALKELYLARDQIKQTIYEVMGISDIMRGATSPYETATAQRIKGTMGTNRLEEQKHVCANFARELLRMKAEIIAKNFDASTLTRMTGEEVSPAIEAILRDDFQRTCSIDVETDSTVAVDEQAEQEANGKVLMVIQGIMAGAAGLLQAGILPPPMVAQFVLELIKMMLHPLRNSRGVVELIDDFQETISAMQQSAAMMPQGPTMPSVGGPVPPGPGGGPQLPPPMGPGGPPMPNGALQ